MNISADQGIPCHVFGTMYSFVNVKNQSKLYIHLIFVFVFNCILSVPTILLNAVSIIAILKSHRLKSMPCYFIIYVQSIIDLAVGILAIPLFLFFITSEIWQLSSCVAGEMVVRLLFTLLGLSSITIFALTMERYIAILHPYFYLTHVTRKKLLIFVGVCTFVEVHVAIISVVIREFMATYGIIKHALVLLFVAFAHTRVYLVVRRLSRSRSKTRDAFSKENLTKMKSFLREIKQARSCVIVVICFFVLTCLPAATLLPLQPSLSKSEQSIFGAWVVTLAFSNSSANSVIFFWTKTPLRNEAIKMCKKVDSRQC